jgi:hypothetical protein
MNLTDLLQAIPENSPSSFSDVDTQTLDTQIKYSELDRFKSNTKDRKWLAVWTAATVSVWLILVLLILIFNNSFLQLTDTVLVTLLGTTTLNVLGLPFIVLRGHFLSSEKCKV